MDFADLHTWDLDTKSARDLQLELASKLDNTTRLGPWRLVAAADVSYNIRNPRLHAAVVVMEAGTFRVIERVGLQAEATFPYVPGLLSFREAPPVLEAIRRLRCRPDVVLCDGQGIAHPRRIGLASHIGLWLGIPTIGCAKSWLHGEYDEPGLRRGDRSALVDRGEILGAVLRTRSGVKPLFVSSGNMCDLESAVAVVLASTTKFRLPDVARLAHAEVTALRTAATGS